jgi:hypothetical protein
LITVITTTTNTAKFFCTFKKILISLAKLYQVMMFMNARTVYSENQSLNCGTCDVFLNVKPDVHLHNVMMLQRHMHGKGNRQ